MGIDIQSAGLKLQEMTDGSGAGVITEWLAKHSSARARFRVRIGNLRKVPRANWSKKQFRYLKKGVFEIKWEAESKPWRALGFDSGEYFLMVIGCTHKDDVYDPPRCIDTAIERKAQIERGERTAIDFAE